MVQMTTHAMGPNTAISTNLLRYAQFALLETVPNTSATTKDSLTTINAKTTVHTQGSQVLNLVVFPLTETTLPAWGMDFVVSAWWQVSYVDGCPPHDDFWG
jgi:hypothetical protein